MGNLKYGDVQCNNVLFLLILIWFSILALSSFITNHVRNQELLGEKRTCEMKMYLYADYKQKRKTLSIIISNHIHDPNFSKTFIHLRYFIPLAYTQIPIFYLILHYTCATFELNFLCKQCFLVFIALRCMFVTRIEISLHDISSCQ